MKLIILVVLLSLTSCAAERVFVRHDTCNHVADNIDDCERAK